MSSDSIGALYFMYSVIFLVMAILFKDIVFLLGVIYTLIQSFCYIFYYEGIIGTTKYFYDYKRGKFDNL